MSKKTKREFTTYSNLAKSQGKSKREVKRELKKRQRAEELATLPKNPFLRFFARLHPKRVFKYWFSMRGLKMIGKIVGITVLVLVVFIGAMYFYFRKELEGLSLDELLKRAETDTVSIYYDRNGEELWRDTGTGEYRLVVRSDQINDYLKKATVAVEDKDFYKHQGVSYTGMIRATINNVLKKGGTQGGSTLTQQLIKQVYFTDEASERGLAGVPRKIKEAILSVEAERMYDKDQILTAYLNVSPYGGRRNGVESATQTYFGHSAKNLGCEIEKVKDDKGNDVENCLSQDRNLAIAEAALLASIPQSPTLYNPYNTDGNTSLINRQHMVLNDMVKMDYITQEEADAAKTVPILEHIKPITNQLAGAKAPYFVQMVKQDLIDKLGASVVGQGGLRITTSLDLRVQNVIDEQVEKLFQGKLPTQYGFDNASVVMIDNQTGQILGLRGGRDYNYPDYGAVNSATAFIQPGSTIKPLVYASLINNQENPNGTFGAGSIIADTPIPQSVYKTDGKNSVKNVDGQFKGNISIRQSLGESRNVPAIRAMAINGTDKTKEDIRAIGDLSYCTDGADQYAGLASAIGSCGVKQTEHTNAIATLARMGTYKPVASIIKVSNAKDEVLYEWSDEGHQAIDPQSAYIISDILADAAAKRGGFGSLLDGMHNMQGGIKSAIKTGTSDIGGKRKDLWMISYTPKATLSVWWGNHVPKALKGNSPSTVLAPMVRDISVPIYNDIFKADGTWKPGAWFTQPLGVQRLTVNDKTDLYPSWYNKQQKINQTVKMTFDKVSKKLAGNCTPEAARESLDVIKNTDPVTKQVTLTPPEGYDAENTDDYHNCSDAVPTVSTIFATPQGNGRHLVSVSVRSGTHPISGVTVSVNGQSYNANLNGGTWDVIVADLAGNVSVHAVVVDQGLYSSDYTQVIPISSDNSGSGDT